MGLDIFFNLATPTDANLDLSHKVIIYVSIAHLLLINSEVLRCEQHAQVKEIVMFSLIIMFSLITKICHDGKLIAKNCTSIINALN